MNKEREKIIAERIAAGRIKFVGVPKTLWIVTYPHDISDVLDILFEADFERLMLQFRGGLDAKDIYGVYAKESDARKDAEKLIASQ